MVVVSGVLEHIEDIGEALKVIKQLAKGMVYIDVPHNLAFSFSSKEEGFRQLAGGSGQIEWHLEKETWERYLTEEFEIIQSIRGPETATEFTWLLKGK